MECQRSLDDSATSMEKTAPEMAPMPAPRTTPLSVASPITDPATAPTTDPTAAKAHVTAAQRTLHASSHAAGQNPVGHSPAPAECRGSGADEAVEAELGPGDADVSILGSGNGGREATVEVN